MFIINVNATTITKGNEIRGAYLRVNNIDFKLNFNYLDDQLIYISNPIIEEIEYQETNVNNETINEIKKLMYYGYNYEDHTAQKWYLITQYMIFDLLYEDVFFITGIKEDITEKYQEEINELKELCKRDDLLPSFETNIILYNKENQLIDKNDILKNYKTNKGNIDDNNLVINDNSNEIIIYNDYDNYLFEAEVYESEGNYIYVPGKLKQKEHKYNFELYFGYLKLEYIIDNYTCTDCENGINYSLYEKNEKILDFNSNDLNKIELAPGEYYLKEKSRDPGYLKNEEIIEFKINNKDTTNIKMNQYIITNTIKIEKTNEEKIDNQSIYYLKDIEGNKLLEINLNTTTEIVIGYGDYFLTHHSNPGYSIEEDIPIKVRTNELVQTKKINSDKIIKIPDTYKEQNYIPILIFSLILALKTKKLCKK